jgi:hypothetical protein
MAIGRQQTPNGAAQHSDVAVYLRRADKLVKDGKYESALAEIIKARTTNPKNLYAIAYEERVRSILSKSKEDGAESTEVTGNTPELEQISNRAIAEAKRSSEAASRMQERLELLKKQEEEARNSESLRRDAIRKKVSELFDRAQDLFRNGEYSRALDEVARINMIDPSNEEITVFEEKVRQEQEAALKKAEEERLKRQAEEEQRRREYLKKELARIKREGEEKRRKEEETRKKAQTQKVMQHLTRARSLFQEGQYEEALSELAFIIVIDPLNEEMITLEQQIRAEEDKRQNDELERYRRLQAEQQKKREATQAKVRKQIETAEEYIKQEKYSDALRVIAAAYVLDPLNDSLQECEKQILQAQEDAQRRAEDERVRKEEELRARQEEEMRRLIHNAQERAAAGENAEVETRKRADKEKITGYLKRAQRYLDEDRFENALGEVALAFVIDPFDDEVISFEKNILDAQERRRSVVVSRQQPDELDDESGGAFTIEEPADHLPDSLSKPALQVLPDDESPVSDTKETEIRPEYPEDLLSDPVIAKKAEEDEITPSGSKGREQKVKPSHNKAPIETTPVAQTNKDTQPIPKPRKSVKPSVDAKEPARTKDAGKEIRKPQSPSVKKVRQADNGGVRPVSKPGADKKSELIAFHLAEARRYRDSDDFDKSKDEIAKAFMIDPLNESIKTFDQETQREHALYIERKKREKAVRTYVNRAKMYAAQEDFQQAYEAIEAGFRIDPSNKDLIEVKDRLDEMQRRWKEAEDLWEKVTANETHSARSGRFDTKQLYKEALANYYMKLEMLDPEHARTNKDGEKAEPDIVDLESEIQDIYVNWQKELERRAEDEKNEAIRKHLDKAKKLLLEESYEEALAEIAFGKMVEDNNQELLSMEKAIWDDLNRKQDGKGAAADSSEEDPSHRERSINVRIHVKAAESLADKKQFAEALDEIAKAYSIDPLNEDIVACESRIRLLADRYARKNAGLKLVYTSRAVNQ